MYSVTSAPHSRQSDKSMRMRRYLISMSVRTLCFLLAIFLTGPARWVCVVLACVLPYIAVVMANAARSRRVAVPATAPTPAAPRALAAPDDPYAR